MSFNWEDQTHARGVSHILEINKDTEIAIDKFNNLRDDFYRFSLIIDGNHAV